MNEDSRQAIGRRGEDVAAAHLQRLGYRILDRNFRTRWGELDIVAFDGRRTIAFCEVKARRVVGAGANPLESVRGMKRAQVRRMARQWLAERRERPFAEVLRFDAIGVTFDTAGALAAIEHVEGAF